MTSIEPTWDVLAVGAGPFNLGLGALATVADDVRVGVFEAAPQLRWHPGLMLADARLQVSFLADLVSLVEPTHPLSFLAYLKERDRMYPFYVRERFHMARSEYEDYLRWSAERIPNLHFGHHVHIVEWSNEHGSFFADIEHGGVRKKVSARHVALGIGTAPFMPDTLAKLPEATKLHSADYLHRTSDIGAARRVTVVGSGQSGAEVALDLLRQRPGPKPEITWLTRTESFAPLDYTKLVLEMTTPEYVSYFHGLDEVTRDRLVKDQWRHYKGISTDTLEDLHDNLYQRAVRFGHTGVELRCATEVFGAKTSANGVVLQCRHKDTGEVFEHPTDLVIAATGYRPRPPRMLEPLFGHIEHDASGRFVVNIDHALNLSEGIGGRIFVSNADTHSHGVAAPDLGIGAYRNARILNAVAGRRLFALPRRTAFTTFPGATP